MSEKVASTQQRRRSTDTSSRGVADTKVLSKKDRKPHAADSSQNGRPLPGRDRGVGRGGRRDSDVDRGGRRDTDDRDRRRDRPLSAKAESYRPTVLKPEPRGDRDRGKEAGDKSVRGIPPTSSISVSSHASQTSDRSVSTLSGVVGQNDPVKVHFGVIRGMPYEFTSNASAAVTPKDMKKYGRKLFADNSQLSILVRRILQEDDRERERRLNAFRNLKDFLSKPENARDVYKQTDSLLLVLHEVLQERSSQKDIKNEVSQCICILGWQLRYEGRRFFSWIFGKLEAAVSDETKLFLLHAVVQTLSQDTTHYYKMQIPMIMTNLQTALENAEVPVVLLSVMSVIHYIAEEYPDVFINNFKDTVDILVGWHIDTTQSASIIKYCSDSLVSFHQFWLSDMEFSTTLLGQFLEDMNAYAEDLLQGSDSGSMSGSGDKSSPDDDVPAPDVCKAKILALLRVFTTVVKSLGEEFTPLHGPPITFSYLSKMFVDVVECVEMVQKEMGDDMTITLTGNECLSVMSDCVQHQLGKFEHTIVPYVLRQLDSFMEEEYPKTQHLLSPLELLFKAIYYMRASFPSDLATSLLGPQSKLRQLRFQPNKEVLAVVLRVYQSLLCVKDIPMLENVYSLLLADLEVAYNTLLVSAKSSVTVQLATDNPFTGTELSILEAKTIAMFDLNAFMDIASAKSSIIGMWALSPSLFDLLSKHLIPVHMPMAEQFPAVHYTLLNTLFAHAQSHGQFISSAFGIATSPSVKIPAITTSSPKTGGHFSNMLTILAQILPHPKVAGDSRKLCLRWLCQILKLPQLRDYSTLYEHSAFTSAIEALLPLAHNPDPDICLAVCTLMQQVLRAVKPSTDFLIGCVEICKIKLVDSNEKVAKSYATLLELIPADILLRNELSPLTLAKRLADQKDSSPAGSSEIDPLGLQVVRLSRCSHINRSPGTFHPHDFKKVMAYILLGEEPSNPDWLARMYHSCQKSESIGRSSDITLSHYIDSNRALQWFWATWEAAQMCVLLKLRTPLGKPQETFRAIENALLEYCRDTKTGDTKCQAHGPTCQAFGPEYTKAQIRPVLLLQFLEHLEKLMYNAYEGCAQAMPTAPKAVRTFFRTNRVTCQDWLRTMRPIAATAASNVGQHAVAIRHGLEMIKDLINKGNTQSHYFEDAVQKVVCSCVYLHCPHPIMGVLSWCQETVGRTLSWVAACIPAAEGKYENCAAEIVHAIKKYLQLDEIPNYPLPPKPRSMMNLKDSPPDSPKNKGYAPPDGVKTRLLTRNTAAAAAELNNNVYSHHVAEYLLNQVTQCYISVSDWTSAIKWQQAAVEIRSHVPNQKHIELTHDMNAIRALSKFEDRDFVEVAKHLDLIPGLSLEGLNPDNIPVMNDDVPDLEAVLDRGLFEFVRALTHFHLSGCYQAPVSLLSDGSTFIHPALSAVIQMLQTAHKMGLCGVQTAWLDWPAYPNQGHTVLMQSTKALINFINEYHQEGLIPLSSDLKLDPSLHDTKVIGRATQVMKYQYYLHMQVAEDNNGLVLDIQNQLVNLQFATAQLARKQGNLTFAKKLLTDQIQLLTTSQDGAGLFTSQGLEIQNSREKAEKPLLSVLSNFKKAGERTMMAFRMERECAKLSLSMGSSTDAWTTMAKCIVDYATHVNVSINSTIEEINTISSCTSRSLLSLVKWFQADYRSAIGHVKQARASDMNDKSSLANSLNVLLDMEHDGVMQRLGLAAYGNGESAEVVGSSPAISENDAACGRLLHLAVMQAPELAKAWATLASWCYRWGRKAVDIASSDGGVQLTEEEKSLVLSILPVGITNSETDGILEILSQAHCSASTIQEEDVIEQMQSAYHDGRETTRKQLKSGCPALKSVDPRVVDQLLEVWNRVCRRIFSHYRLAARGYFTFLKLTGGKFADKAPGSNNNPAALRPQSSVDESMQETVESQATQEDGNITATLRLLRLLVKYAGELRDVLEDGLANTPTSPWKSIIPQLFSRLNHPEAYVRQSISDLMCRVAVDSPHLIVYQAVVGSPTSSDHKKNKDVVQQSMLTKLLTSPSKEDVARARAESDQSQNQAENPQDLEKSIEEEERNRSMSMLEDCLQAIVTTLSKHNPTLVCQVEVLVQELRRITVLWEELWLGTLTQLHVDVTRRLHQLEEEVKRVKNNDSLSAEEKELIIAEKHNAIMKPIVYALEQVHSITSENAETPNEKSFQDTFQATIEKALTALKTPKDPSHPLTSWTLFKQLQGILQQRATKRATFMLQMSDISPKLASMKDTIIPLPGLVCPPSQVMSIDSFAESVNILPTKTKPKKLVFIGRDSKRYTYLFKGLEDLHLDERIMQFLAIVNTMFAKNKRQDASLYHACHYSVTPLGPRSGLIQWVDGATPLFGLYKRWQQREANAAAVAKGANSNVQPPVARPSEVFYGKMTPALKDAGLSDKESRKDWPMTVMKDVLKDLMSETPKDLLAKELWCSSGSASEWWYVTQAYSRSTAVMSIIGYIIGLGDRHLDNVLVNFLTGDVVHIDYNVCFEKGKNLRVPERVPFRMTQNIETALGVTGVEGTFRQTAEEVLKIMRKGRETLLTLLEAFVYDPLVDWTTGNEGGFASAFYGGGQMNPVVADGGEKKREMEKEITRSLFSSRVAEMKAPWFKNRDAILEEISKLEDILKAYLATIEKSKSLDEITIQHKKQSEILHVALGDKNHELHTLGTRYSEVSKLQSTRTSVLTAIQDKLRELEHWHAQHTVALETARGQHLTAISKEMEQPLDLGGGPYVPVVTFLKTAGQMQVISQCEHVETELCSLIHQRRALLIGCVDVLQAYCQLAQQFPVKFAEMNRAYIWQQWIQELICDFTAAKCDDIIDRYQDHFSPPDPNQIQQVVTIELNLQGVAADANTKLVKAMETLKQEQTDRPHAEASAQQYETQINKYIQENGDGGSVTLIAVIMNVMSSFCKRSLIMEGAVASAGDLLVDFTTRNGNWFLEELCSMINNLDNFFKFIYFCSFPSTFDVAQVFAAVDCFRSLKNVYSQLQELHSQFKKVLTPLVLKSIQSEDPSVALILKAFNDMCQNPELPLQKVAYQIEQDLATVTLGMQTELTSSQPVQLLRSRFASLIEPTINTSNPSNPTAMPLTTGQSLLAACNAVFQQLLGPVRQFVTQMDGLPVPQEWRKVDVIQDAKGLKATVLNSNTQELLMDMFFVKQLQALNEFFLLCRCYAAASKGDQDECNKLNTLLTGQHGSPEISALLFTESQLVQPIKKFLAHYIRKQILGIATQVICLCACTFAHQLGLDTVAAINVIDIGANSKYSIDVLIKKAVEVSIQKGLVRSHLYSLLNNITSSYDTAWRAADQARQLNAALGIAKDVANRAQSQLVRYQWLHEDILQQAGHQRQNAPFQNPPRSSVMSDLRKRVHLLVSLEGAISAVQERSTSLHASISQRLKWASGANPSLNAVLRQFDEAVGDRNKIYAVENKHSKEVSALSNAILHFEALRTRTTEAMNAESNFLTLLNRTLESCEAMESSTATVTKVEEGFIRLKPPTPDQPINHKWMRQVLDLLKKKAKERDKKAEEQKLKVQSGKDALHTQVDTVKNTLGTHHKLMSEVKGLLKTIARGEEEEEQQTADGEEGTTGDVRAFMMAYRSFSEEFTNMLKVLLVGSSAEDIHKVLELEDMIPKIREQAEHTKRLYDHLVSLADPLLSKLNEEEETNQQVATERKESSGDIGDSSGKDGTAGSKTGSPTRPPPGFARLVEGTPATPPTGTKPATAATKPPQAVRDPRTGKMLQVRNTHAINVWRRVKGKLDGRDPDPTKRLTVAEQIDFVIKEATGMENLATLYEGWTAWV